MAPFALEQTLFFQAPDQRIQGALVNIQPLAADLFSQGIALVLFTQLGQYGQGKAAAAQFQSQLFKNFAAFHSLNRYTG